jgi:hypothetical protein
LEGVSVFVFDRAPLAGEPADRVLPRRATTSRGGEFRVQLPASWRGDTVYVTVWANQRQLGSAVHPVSVHESVLVNDPSKPPGLWFAVRWTADRPKDAAMMLQNPDRTMGFGEAMFGSEEDRVFLELRDDHGRIDGRLKLLVGALPNPAKPRMEVLHVVESADVDELAAIRQLDINCVMTRVRVPSYEDVAPIKVGFWTRFDAAPAQIHSVDDGSVSHLLATSFSYEARGIGARGETVLGYVERAGREASIVWRHRIDPKLTQEMLVVDERGVGIPNAIVRFLLRDSDPRCPRPHDKAGRTDVNGRLTSSGFCAAEYEVIAETMELGRWREHRQRIRIPCAPIRVQLSDAHVCRLVPSGLPAGVAATEMLGWTRRPGGTWRECSSREWRFAESGLVGLGAGGVHEFLLRLPPFVGHAAADLDRVNQVVDVTVPMTLETSIQGHLVDDQGTAIPERWVSLLDVAQHGEPAGPSWTKARTNVRGEFEIVVLPGLPNEIAVWDAEVTRVLRRFPAAPGILRVTSTVGR